MKKVILSAFLLLSVVLNTANAQNHYWVMLTDKQGTSFDPYSYFDAKAIERYRLNDADLYDISNYPLNGTYVKQIEDILSSNSESELFGTSRWLNAVAVTATPEQIELIGQKSFVKEVIIIAGDMQTAKTEQYDVTEMMNLDDMADLSDQLVRMGGKYFRNKNINGKGIRIAVFDGGFPMVNTHDAFKHLRDEGRIIKTWNFPNRKEDVYGWNSHGLMTLSCIAGRRGDTDLGLATGAEFLLARTEVEAEPRKEEVWWQMAVEWADKNGAQIISSSLGYGKDRYYTKDMNGTSLVAKAGNMAARKGILVCNSAGNEGSDRSWRTIITPSDADSVLCVGGINPSLMNYERAVFSSFGPSADGRMKPNVCAFAYAWTAAKSFRNDKYNEVPGTSFSCPLVAGFAACALQSKPGMKAMELFHEIEKSADLYPYCDYTFGYGVPQADYFTGDRKEVTPTFRFETNAEDGSLNIVPLKDHDRCRVFIKNSLPNGTIIDYTKMELDEFTTSMWINIPEGCIITVNFEGYTESHIFSTPNNSDTPLMAKLQDKNSQYDDKIVKVTSNNRHFSTRLHESKVRPEFYVMLGVPIQTNDNELESNFWSPAKRLGVRYTCYFTKAYGWGLALEYGRNSFRFDKEAPSNVLDNLTGMNNLVDSADNIYKHKLLTNQFSAEIYQRVRLYPGGITHKGWHWDLGGYITLSNNIYRLKYNQDADAIAENRDIRLKNTNPLRGEKLQYGVTTRFTNDHIGIYCRYNLHRLNKTLANDEIALPALEVGLHLSF